MTEIFLGLGSNLGDRRTNLQGALETLADLGVTAAQTSSCYETEPVGLLEQPSFLNAASRVETELSPQELLQACLDTESRLGRVRETRWGPRTIDLDLLFYGQRRLATPDLTIPHPRLSQRRFVLQPLFELAPDFCDPVSGRTIRQLLADCPDRSRVTPVAGCLDWNRAKRIG